MIWKEVLTVEKCVFKVITINFEVPKEKNPDDLLDEEVKEQILEDDAVSMSKHSEENENSIDLEDHGMSVLLYLTLQCLGNNYTFTFSTTK